VRLHAAEMAGFSQSAALTAAAAHELPGRVLSRHSGPKLTLVFGMTYGANGITTVRSGLVGTTSSAAKVVTCSVTVLGAGVSDAGRVRLGSHVSYEKNSSTGVLLPVAESSIVTLNTCTPRSQFFGSTQHHALAHAEPFRTFVFPTIQPRSVASHAWQMSLPNLRKSVLGNRTGETDRKEKDFESRRNKERSGTGAKSDQCHRVG
jgi:hypothetical protein